MTALLRAMAALSLALAATAASAQPAPAQPPMNDFDQAFYRCDGGEAFMLTYDSEQPKAAEMVTNSDNRRYQLKRTEPKTGFEFSGGGAKFWTDGKSAVMESAKGSFKNCKTKTS